MIDNGAWHASVTPSPLSAAPCLHCLRIKSAINENQRTCQGFVAASKVPPLPSSSSSSLSTLPHLSWTTLASCPKNGNVQRGDNDDDVAFNSHIIYDALHFDLGCRQSREVTPLVASRPERGEGTVLTWLSYELAKAWRQLMDALGGGSAQFKLTLSLPQSLSLCPFLLLCLFPSPSLFLSLPHTPRTFAA